MRYFLIALVLQKKFILESANRLLSSFIRVIAGHSMYAADW
jgi:hypothetical protein